MKELKAKEVEKMLNDNANINLIDVREVDEVKAGKIPNAIHIPLGLMEAKMPDLDKKKEYIMVCQSGGRSGRAAKYLEDYGFKVNNMTGGMLEWEGNVE